MSFVYDKKDRLAGVYEEEDLVASYTYDANGNRDSLTYGNGTGADYAYNLANLVTSLENTEGSATLSSYAYTYYLDGNQATKTDHTGRQTGYAYDGLGRLTQEAESGAADAITKAYTFDPAGNRASMTVSGTESYAADYDHDLNNRLTAETKVTGSVTEVIDYFYDDNGNTIAKRTGTLTASGGSETPVLSIDMTGTELYRYDGFDRMTGVENAGGTSIYTYRPDGLRLSKTVDGVTTTHVWEGNQITLELDEDDAVTNKYIRGINLIFSDDGTGANKRYFLYNGHGDAVQLADASGDVVKSYDYDAFGNEKDIDADGTNPFRYSGEYYDAETGTIYLRARYYEPGIGRFLAEDSYLGNNNDPLSLNLYTYCYNNPARYTDSSGNIPVETVIDIASVGWSATAFINNPSWANAGFLAWDVAAALLPYVPGSYVAKGAKLLGTADDVADIAMALSKADNITDAASAFKQNRGSIIMGYKELKNTVKSLKISGLEVHHLFEKRFADKLGLKADSILSVAMDKDTHKQITKLMRQKIGYSLDLSNPYRTNNVDVQKIWDVTVEVYTQLGMKQYLDPLKQQLIKAGTAKHISDWGKW